MDGTWNVYVEERTVGACRLWREGLYICISCRCERAGEGICRLELRCGEETVDLGVLVPTDGGFGLDRKLSARSIPSGELRFYLKIPGRQVKEKFIPVREGEAFPCLSKLTDARFGEREGQVGVFLD